jgi:nucleoside-diphosphate-sugar epimerase
MFVTGATGVLGRRVVPLLLAEGHNVTAIARSEEKSQSLSSIGAEPVSVDLFDAEALTAASARADAIVNLATHIPTPRNAGRPGAWKENTRIRTETSKHLADAARKNSIPRVVQESLWLIYDDAGDGWIHESSPQRTTPFTHPALVAESNVLPLNNEDGHTAVALRFAQFYGPDSLQSQTYVSQIKKGHIGIIGKPQAYLAQLDLDDAAAAVIAALSMPGGAYNVIDNDPPTRKEFVDAVSETLGVEPVSFPKVQPLMMLGDKMIGGVQRSLRISNTRLSESSSWRPRWESSLDGVRNLAEQLRGA